ncbi:small ribosomal subunit protein mS22-like isoform X2 [Halichondria panicea]|uniref:small ribosomal subunit protein mS22-like isoform X2 n=1 Tax=Halichondria panicea TaxID=6063 RepID=UPI00312B8D1E
MVSRISVPLLRVSLLQCRTFCTQEFPVGPNDERVQELLLRMTGMDFDKVFAAKKEPLKLPQYRLMTMEELKEVHAETTAKAGELLRMPPIVPVREPQGEVGERDEILDQYLDNKMVFTDTTQHKENKERRIVVRETDGTLRDANWDERDRMCQLFFPVLGRKMWLPPVLQGGSETMASLRSHFHVNILDRVCLQCEPDSEDYTKIHHAVYDHTDENRLHDLLRSTTYFGSMVWYLVTVKNNISGLLKDMLSKKLLSDAVDLLALYSMVYPETELPHNTTDTDITKIQFIKEFCDKQELKELFSLVRSIQHELLQQDSSHTDTREQVV